MIGFFMTIIARFLALITSMDDMAVFTLDLFYSMDAVGVGFGCSLVTGST